MTSWLLISLVFFGANLPWFSNKLFYMIPLGSAPIKSGTKSLGWCLLELTVIYFLLGGVSLYAEQASFGQVANQGWEFFAVTACLFLVFAFPGFVYKVLWK
jgi:hypothetical protein